MKAYIAAFAVQLRHHREASGLSQHDVAERLKIGHRTYQRIETGESSPSLDLIFQLAKVLNFNLDEIFAPDKKILEFDNLKIFTKDNEKEFINDPAIQNSRILELTKLDISKGEGVIINHPLFKDSEYYMGVTNFRNVIMNPALQKRLGFKQNIMVTAAATQQVREQGVLWAYLIKTQTKYVIENRINPFPIGLTNVVLKRCFIYQNDQYLIVSLAEILENPS